MEARSLDGQVVLVTGGTSGIGAACVRALAAAGARVAFGGRREERLKKLADEVGAERALPVRMDVRSPVDSRRFAEAAVARFGRVDALVASAGVGAYGSAGQSKARTKTRKRPTSMGRPLLVRDARYGI